MFGSKQTMKSIRYARYGGPDVLEYVESEIPRPRWGEVVVDVLASGINHIEAFVREGHLAETVPIDLPAGQGSDFAGLVREVGTGVEGWKRGDEVIGHAVRGAHATHVVVPAASLVRKPKRVSWEEAGGLYLAGITALDTLDGLHLGAGDTLVISAAAGGVGNIEAQLAKFAGVKVIGTCGERNHDFLREQGITPVVYGDGMAARIRKLAPNGVTAFIDNFGQDGQELAFELGVEPNRYRSSEDRKVIELAALAPDEDFAEHATKQLQRLAELTADHALHVVVSAFYPFDLLIDAFEDLERLHARGKIIVGMRPANPEKIIKQRDLHDARP
ncbi:MAG TPA: NADP-dependent oxidoreductase [Plantibacter sp.]|uniref:NADP-dependent oxidoreductase n=1 Tax=unclassified Plantibacter TaxID=2624265 RepID=UPI002CE1EBFB|nr:NADP-dependent oxidoreductase [Plantibacter sp.]